VVNFTVSTGTNIPAPTPTPEPTPEPDYNELDSDPTGYYPQPQPTPEAPSGYPSLNDNYPDNGNDAGSESTGPPLSSSVLHVSLWDVPPGTESVHLRVWKTDAVGDMSLITNYRVNVNDFPIPLRVEG